MSMKFIWDQDQNGLLLTQKYISETVTYVQKRHIYIYKMDSNQVALVISAFTPAQIGSQLLNVIFHIYFILFNPLTVQ